MIKSKPKVCKRIKKEEIRKDLNPNEMLGK